MGLNNDFIKAVIIVTVMYNANTCIYFYRSETT